VSLAFIGSAISLIYLIFLSNFKTYTKVPDALTASAGKHPKKVQEQRMGQGKLQPPVEHVLQEDFTPPEII